MTAINREKALAALLGVAIGDALGGPVEFMSRKDILQTHGGPIESIIGGGWLNLEPGETTDDTAMTVAVLEGIQESREDPVARIGDHFLAWVDTNPKDIGGTCAQAISRARRAIEVGSGNKQVAWQLAGTTTAEANGYRSGGNGALMRTVPVAVAYAGAELEERTKEIAEMTHYDELSTAICTGYNKIIRALLEGREDDALKLLNYQAAEYFNVQTKPSGWSKDSIDCAYKAIADGLNTKARRKQPDADRQAFKDALLCAVNWGGDADTIGAITGGLAGALFGLQAIPGEWIAAIDKANPGLVDKFKNFVKEAEAWAAE